MLITKGLFIVGITLSLNTLCISAAAADSDEAVSPLTLVGFTEAQGESEEVSPAAGRSLSPIYAIIVPGCGGSQCPAGNWQATNVACCTTAYPYYSLTDLKCHKNAPTCDVGLLLDTDNLVLPCASNANYGFYVTSTLC